MPNNKLTEQTTACLRLSKKDIIAKTAKETNIYKNSITLVFDAIEKVIYEELLKSGNDKSNIELDIFEGIKITGFYKSERQGFDPRDRKEILVKPKLVLNAKFTDAYKRKVNNSLRAQVENEAGECELKGDQ